MKRTFFEMQNYMIETSLKIFLRELKKFCNTICHDFSTFLDEYPTLINILMLVVIVKWQIYIWKKCHFQMLSCRHCLKMKMKIVYHKSVCRQSARNRILPSYASLDGQMDGRMVVWYFSTFYQTLSPIRTAAPLPPDNLQHL